MTFGSDNGRIRTGDYMATWGRIKIRYNGYRKDDTLYYDYNTTSDQYFFLWTWRDDDWGGDGKVHEIRDYQSPASGEAQMEAYIHHILAFDYGGDVDAFVERYIKNNRFADEWNRIEEK